MAGNDLHADALNPGFMAAEVDVQASKTGRIMASLAGQSTTLQGRSSLLRRRRWLNSLAGSSAGQSLNQTTTERSAAGAGCVRFMPSGQWWTECHRFRQETQQPIPTELRGLLDPSLACLLVERDSPEGTKNTAPTDPARAEPQTSQARPSIHRTTLKQGSSIWTQSTSPERAIAHPGNQYKP